jgi:hypothetical protein
MKKIMESSALAVACLIIAGCASTPPAEKELPAAAAPIAQLTPAPAAAATAAAPAEAVKAQAAASYGKVSPFFTENHGQVDQAVKYYVKGSRGTVYFTPSEVVYDFLREKENPEGETEEETPEPRGPGRDAEKKKEYDRLVFRAKFAGADPAVAVAGAKELPGKVNYFIGSQANWRPNIPTFEEISYRNLYPAIDVLYRFDGNNPRSLFTVRPGGDPQAIRILYEGVESLEVDPEGNLTMLTSFGAFGEKAPRAYQEIGGEKREVPVKFSLSATDQAVSFEIPAYDASAPLIIE